MNDIIDRFTIEIGNGTANASSAAVHRIDVIDCLDAGVIVHRYAADHDQACEYRTTGRHPTGTDTHTDIATTEPSRRQAREPTIDVLHGVPHEAIREYAGTHAIDLIIICVHERARSQRTFLGNTLTSHLLALLCIATLVVS